MIIGREWNFLKTMVELKKHCEKYKIEFCSPFQKAVDNEVGIKYFK